MQRRPRHERKILYLEHLTVSFDGFKALNDLSLYVEPGELRCIIGPNGAGKTTMMDVVTGKTRPDHGTAWFGRHIDLLDADRAARSRRPASAASFRSRPCSSSFTRVREPGAGAGRRQVVLEGAGARG